MRPNLMRCLLLVLAAGSLLPHQADAQNRIRLPSQVQLPQGVPPAPVVAPWSVPSAPPIVGLPSVSLGTQIQPFDPYSVTVPRPPTYGPAQPLLPPPGGLLPPVGAPLLPPAQVLPPTYPGPVPPSAWPAPTLPPASTIPTLPPLPLNPGYNQPPPGLAPVFPDGLPWASGGGVGRSERLFQDTGGIYTWLAGDSGSDLEMNEFEVFTSAVFKNFAHSANGLRLTPGFIFHFTDGPAVAGGLSLPSALYSAYLDGLWLPQLSPQFSADINMRVGVYSDFDRVISDSVRLTGRGLGVLQMTPTTSFKLGVEYLDRNRIKLLPAGGVLWTPNPQTRFDIYFPRPKLAQYWTTVGNTEVWWYLGGEYGGGAWTIAREVPPAGGERIDINDIRIFVGIEWDRLQASNGLLEVGWVTDREIYVADRRTEGVRPNDTVMVRAGFSF